MKPRSELVSGPSWPAGEGNRKGESVIARMSSAERRAMILEKAGEFFSEYGLTAQTRALAKMTGIAQRLLYRHFPSKSELLKEVYQNTIVSPFKAVWLAQLEDRSSSMETRLNLFYRDYFRTVLTRRWLRLFLYASLGEAEVAPDYIQSIVSRILTVIAVETARERDVALPKDEHATRQIAWILHGSISHLAIRQHIYGARRELVDEDVIALHVRCFVAGFEAAVENAHEMAKNKAA